MTCKNKLKNNCGNLKNYATCTYYETQLPLWSELIDEDCVVIEETTTELYEEVGKLKEKLDYNEITTSCPDIIFQREDGKITPISFAKTIVDILEEVKCPNIELSKKDIDITEYALNFKCIVDPCGTPITKLSQLLQILIDKECL